MTSGIVVGLGSITTRVWEGSVLIPGEGIGVGSVGRVRLGVGLTASPVP